MITPDKVRTDIVAYWFAAMLLFILAGRYGRYGRQAVEWVLMKLYEFFIQRNPMKL
jgi:hypothetical protein